jgi:hypothetical protein
MKLTAQRRDAGTTQDIQVGRVRMSLKRAGSNQVANDTGRFERETEASKRPPTRMVGARGVERVELISSADVSGLHQSGP